MTEIVPASSRTLKFISKPAPWMRNASCLNTVMMDGISIHFPTGKIPDWLPARRMCASCPVLQECHDHFNEPPLPSIGMFFGLTPNERKLHFKNSRRSTKRPRQPWQVPLEKLSDTPRNRGVWSSGKREPRIKKAS